MLRIRFSKRLYRYAFLALAPVMVALLSYFAVDSIGYTGTTDGSTRAGDRSETSAISGTSIESGLRLTLVNVRETAFFTVLDLRIQPDQDLAYELVEVAPIGPDQLRTSGFSNMPINAGSIGMGVGDGQSNGATIQILVGPVSRHTDSWSITIERLTVLYRSHDEWSTVTGPWHLELEDDDIHGGQAPDHIEVNETLHKDERAVTIRSLIVSDSEIAVAYDPYLGEDVLPMGHEVTVRTDRGEIVHGQSVPAPRSNANDTRMKVFPLSRDTVSTIDVIPGRYMVTDEKTLEVNLPLPGEVLGPADETISVDVNIQVDHDGLQTNVFGIQAATIDEEHAFLIAASSYDRNNDPVYLVAPGRDEIKARDDLGNEYLYAGGSFGEGWSDLQFQGPIDKNASELTILVNRVGMEVEFGESVRVMLGSGESTIEP